MTTRDTPFAPGTPSWVDLFTSDVDAAKAFYTALFGWEAVDSGPDFGGYVRFTKDGSAVAGMMGATDGTPTAWSTYVTVTDAEATAAAVRAAGGGVLAEPMAVGPLGSMAVFTEPSGGVFGVWQPAEFVGFERYNEPGSVTWDEFNSRDYQASKDFYATVFGWTYDITSDTDDFKYVTAKVDGTEVAGIMDAANFLPPGVPSHWGLYFTVDDVDAAVAEVSSLGGAVLRPAEDSPFGRIATVQDPTGASFQLHSVRLGDGSTLGG